MQSYKMPYTHSTPHPLHAHNTLTHTHSKWSHIGNNALNCRPSYVLWILPEWKSLFFFNHTTATIASALLIISLLIVESTFYHTKVEPNWKIAPLTRKWKWPHLGIAPHTTANTYQITLDTCELFVHSNGANDHDECVMTHHHRSCEGKDCQIH